MAAPFSFTSELLLGSNSLASRDSPCIASHFAHWHMLAADAWNTRTSGTLRRVHSMRRPYLLISGAWLIHAVSWFLPAVRGVDTNLAGWQAFLLTVWAILLPDRARSFQMSFQVLLQVLSALSTVLFVLVSPWIVGAGSRRWLYASAWVAVAAFIVNVQWYVDFSIGQAERRGRIFPLVGVIRSAGDRLVRSRASRGRSYPAPQDHLSQI